MTVGPTAQPSFSDLPVGWFRELKVGHEPMDPAEATLVLAAAAAANGLRCDGTVMPGSQSSSAPSLEAIARQLCQPISAVRRGVQHLIGINAVHVHEGVHVHPEALAARWTNYRQRICISAEARLLRMRPKPLLLTALVAGQMNRRGHLRLGTKFLQERTGFTERTVERTLAAARGAGAIRTWKTPNNWQLYSSTGLSRSGGRTGSQSGGRSDSQRVGAAVKGGSAPGDHHQVAVVPLSKWRDTGDEVAAQPPQSGGRTPDAPGVPPVSPPDTPASPAGETRSAPAAEPEPSELQNRPVNVPGTIDAWVKQHADAMSFDAGNGMEVAAVAMLIDSISPRPAVIRDLRAFAGERRSFARSVIRWCPWPDRLGRWLVRAHRWFGVQNLGAYLRRASEKGNPETLLESHSKNVLGRAAEKWQDFSPQTERALRGPCADKIEQLVAGISGVLQLPDEEQRIHLREELARYWKQQRRVAARVTLQKLVCNDCSDVAIARATEGILTLKQGKWLLGAA